MRIDAHQHYWKVDRGDYGWLTPQTGILYEDYLPERLKPHLQSNAMDRTIVVQAAPTIAETEYLLALSDEEPTIAGVVGWLDVESEAFEEQLTRLRKHPRFVGVRPMLQDLEPEYLLRPEVMRSFEVLERHQFPLDWLVRPQHLPAVKQVMQRFPRLRAVIDHLAKPAIASGVMEPWASEIRELAAAFPGMYCKLSGMVTEADHEHWETEQLTPYVEHCVSAFGWDRVMFGSDWPVCVLAAEYDEVVTSTKTAFREPLTEEQERKLFSQNAIDFYGLATE